MLVRVGRLTEADTYVSRLTSLGPGVGAVADVSNSLSVSLAAQLDQPAEALRRAQQWVSEQPQDATARMLLGNVLALNGKVDEAEQALIEATRLASADVRTWNALFGFYLSRNPEAARTTLESMAQKVQLAEATRAAVLARGHELLRDSAEAEKLYRQAIQLEPRDTASHLRLASLLAARDPDAAEQVVGQLLKLQPESAEARRMLAALRASRGGANAWREVEQVLGTVGPSQTGTSADRQWQARLLARVGGTQNIAKARQTLESLVIGQLSPLPADRELLAQVYEAEGKPNAARQQYQALAESAGSNPAMLALYADFLLRQQDLPAAKQALTQLDKLTGALPAPSGSSTSPCRHGCCMRRPTTRQ